MSYIGNTATQQAFTPAVDFFNGNGSTTAFTLSRPVASVAQVQAVISNVPQKPGDAFTVSGNTITFTSAPPSGTQNIYVYYTSPITQVIAPGQNTVGTTQIQDNAITTAKIAPGAVIPADLSTGAPTWDVNGNASLNGVTPSSWGSLLKAFEFGAGFVGSYNNANAYLGVNCYWDGANWKYKADGAAHQIIADKNNGFSVQSASSGSAGANITFTQALQVIKGTTLALEGASTQTGTGITFPATQNASSNANTLDDYEEGSFTPALAATGYTFSFSNQTGIYTKIGNCVLFKIYFAATYVSGSGTVSGVITGLPFGAGTSAANYGGCTIFPDTGSAFFSRTAAIRTNPTSTALTIANGFGGSAVQFNFNWATLPTTTEFELSGHYMI